MESGETVKCFLATGWFVYYGFPGVNFETQAP
jgi:hypothetical protein